MPDLCLTEQAVQCTVLADPAPVWTWPAIWQTLFGFLSFGCAVVAICIATRLHGEMKALTKGSTLISSMHATLQFLREVIANKKVEKSEAKADKDRGEIEQ